ncbi:hypothetical protein LZ198_31310 [Myxococcus sp. K15C18031901]|uniref:hypothetical protein n=1 Tax=Myxococcus dinghuensis TaxID=2906761 RepID=UPI0020A802BD|nr:hypothetical protein [Myxococcus dinghuensis]MCP3103381.1 hypothetical protein [Myxococcus dinghuensis]
MNKTFAVLSCVVTMALMGCGGAPEQEAAPEDVQSAEQSIIWACDGTREFDRIWSRNGVEVGRESCYCDGSTYAAGTLSGSYTQNLIRYCN